jgi:hypothetical protein
MIAITGFKALVQWAIGRISLDTSMRGFYHEIDVMKFISTAT